MAHKRNTARSKTYYDLEQVEPEAYEYKEGNHRYGLKFVTKKHQGGKTAAIIQMNGSTTNWIDGKNDWTPDATIGKVLCWCYENQQTPFDIVHCLNLWSYVDKNPKGLTGKNNENLNHPKNDVWIAQICEHIDYVIIAYGDCKGVDRGVFKERKTQLLELLNSKDLHQVGELTTKGKNPKHGRGWNGNPSLKLFRENVK